MATILSQWEQTWQYDPTNPLQKSYAYYTGIPGGYSTFYYNRVPTTAQLSGLGLSWSDIPDWVTMALVTATGVGLGYLGAKHLGPRFKRLRR